MDANNLSQNSAANDGEEVGVAAPAPDTIQEFKVQTGNYDASYGRGTGANVDVVSKTGTNQYHGSAWEFLRNDIFNANNFFSKLTNQPRAVLKQNQFGASVGGPIRRDNLFFFGAYQGLRSSNGLGDQVTVNLPQLTSDRSAANIGAQFCAYPTAAGGTQVACDGSNINPVALALLNFKLPERTVCRSKPADSACPPPIQRRCRSANQLIRNAGKVQRRSVHSERRCKDLAKEPVRCAILLLARANYRAFLA